MAQELGVERKFHGASRKNSRRETEMSDRAAAIVEEMADKVRFIGGGEDVVAKIANNRAARLTGLPVTTIERLRWRKIKRIPADIVDAVREARDAFAARQEQKARHVAALLRAELSAFADVDRPEADAGRAGRDASLPTDRAVGLD